MRKRVQITITGQVQGVGFRPHVYRIAQQVKLTGWVKNTAKGVVIESQGVHLDLFLQLLQQEAPPLACIESITINPLPLQKQEKTFSIIKSDSGQNTTKIAPDTAICDDCLQELFDAKNRFYQYPFVNCTNCGPRFTITSQLPYDRPYTSMHAFSLCPDCQEDYNNPMNRRYHAQPIACPNCGPQLSHTLDEIAQEISNGKILAIKSIGGYQLVCDAMNEKAIETLRERKKRPTKPFALMLLNLASVNALVETNDNEQHWLTHFSRPIILLQKKHSPLPESIAPGLSQLGIMLPSSPHHYLIFHALAGYPSNTSWLARPSPIVLVVTSANVSSNPLLADNIKAKHELQNMADICVTHNRSIICRADDSVLRVVSRKPLLIRRARGFAPMTIKLSKKIPSILALGGYLKNTFCITRNDEAYISQHIGDLNNSETIAFFHESIEHMSRLLNITPEIIVHDLHPDFYTTYLSQSFSLPYISVQHHHAHLAAVAAEHHIETPVLGLALDGYGYGDDSEAWGGELLYLENDHYQRLGHFEPLSQPGGDKAAKEPWRMAVSTLWQLNHGEIAKQRYHQFPHFNNLLQLLDNNIHSPKTSSCGRLFDAASSLLGILHISHYEAEAAMRLESLVTNPIALPHGYTLNNNRFSLLPTLEYLLSCDPVTGANVFHGTLITGLSEWIFQWTQQLQLKTVLLSGGCFLNRILSEGLTQALCKKGVSALLPIQLPPNDGGIALGQAWIAGLRTHLCV